MREEYHLLAAREPVARVRALMDAERGEQRSAITLKLAVSLGTAGSTASRMIFEPFGRITAAIAAVAALDPAAQDANGLVLLPADHHIADDRGLWRVVEVLEGAQDGHLVTLGIRLAVTGSGHW